LDLIYNEVDELYRKSKVNTALCELRNMINVAHLIIHQSLERKENRGGCYNIDNEFNITSAYT
jgi:L-aspartate oxidase